MERNARLLQAREALDQLGPVAVEKRDENALNAADLLRLEHTLQSNIKGRWIPASRWRPWLHVEAEVHDVAFAHDVFLALEPQLAGVARARLALAAVLGSRRRR